MQDDAKIEHLAQTPLFSTLGRKDLRRVAQLCTSVILEPGRVMCREGEHGDEFFVVRDGRFRVEQRGREVAELGPGDFFGELALLDGGTRTATVTALTAARVLVVDRREFTAMIREEPQVAVQMLPAIGMRIRRLVEADAAQPLGV